MRKVRVVVCQRNKAFFLMQLRLMNTAHCPLTRFFQTAADTLAARNYNRHVDITESDVEHDRAIAGRVQVTRAIPANRVIARHRLEPDAASHWIATNIFPVRVHRVACEITPGLPPAHAVSEHKDLRLSSRPLEQNELREAHSIMI